MPINLKPTDKQIIKKGELGKFIFFLVGRLIEIKKEGIGWEFDIDFTITRIQQHYNKKGWGLISLQEIEEKLDFLKKHTDKAENSPIITSYEVKPRQLIVVKGTNYDKLNRFSKKIQKFVHAEITDIRVNPNKEDVFIEPKYGIYMDEINKEPKCPIRGDKRIETLRNLKNKVNTIKGKDLARIQGQTLAGICKQIGEINKGFRKHLGIQRNDLIYRSTTGGYKFNNEEYEIKFIEN